MMNGTVEKGSPMNHGPEEEYTRLALETKELFSPSTFFHPWTAAPRGNETGSVAIVELSSNERASVTQPKDAGELRAWLQKPSSPISASQASKPNRLIILEDLDQRYLNIIGSCLGVPPVVFLAHAAGPYVDDIVDEECLAHDRTQYWRVKTFQLHEVNPVHDQAFGIYVGRDTVLDRTMQYLDKDRAFHPSAHLVSFWSTVDSAGSWTAVILVDPVLTNVVHSSHLASPRDDPVYNLTLQHSDLGNNRLPLPAKFSVDKLSGTSQEWKRPAHNALSISLFDNLVESYSRRPHNTTPNPVSAANVCRNLILSTWQGVIRAKEKDYYYFWENISFSKSHYASSGSWYSAWESTWQREYFHALTYHMMTVMNRRKDIDETFRTLGFSSSAANHSAFSPRELRDWQALRDRAAALQERFSHTIATYEQRASVEESLLANKQARSVGHLSVLATVLVPFSVVAGIFSMSGKFAAGEDLFWVFWILAPSISVFLMVWLFFERIDWALWRILTREKAVLPLHEKTK